MMRQKIGLSLQEQPDLLDIHRSYQQAGGEFWIALSDDRVIGTIGLTISYWTRLQWHMQRIDFMRKWDFVKSVLHSYRYRMIILTGIVFYIY